MDNLDTIIEKIRATFTARNATRDLTLGRSRELIRFCSLTIRAVHREEFGEAEQLLGTAMQAAAAMKADKLVVVSDTHGIRSDPKDPATMIPHITVSQIGELVKSGAISAGMLPKVESCITALKGGVAKTHIIDGRIPHSLLLEIYTEAGIGTEIVL